MNMDTRISNLIDTYSKYKHSLLGMRYIGLSVPAVSEDKAYIHFKDADKMATQYLIKVSFFEQENERLNDTIRKQKASFSDLLATIKQKDKKLDSNNAFIEKIGEAFCTLDKEDRDEFVRQLYSIEKAISCTISMGYNQATIITQENYPIGCKKNE